jgi:hypothetical protein
MFQSQLQHPNAAVIFAPKIRKHLAALAVSRKDLERAFSDAAAATEITLHNSTTPQQTLILEPGDFAKNNSKTTKDFQELFVEMCFYARLGFVQPPCCLQCTYRESVVVPSSNMQLDAPCERWLAWRKDASQPLHPKTLETNLCLLQCHVARQLTMGAIVGDRRWDAQQMMLLEM